MKLVIFGPSSNKETVTRGKENKNSRDKRNGNIKTSERNYNNMNKEDTRMI
jgi:hypothetical protein